jgi:hypothetical protein
MISYILFLLAKGLATIAMGLLLAIGFNWGGMLVQRMNQKMGLVPA